MQAVALSPVRVVSRGAVIDVTDTPIDLTLLDWLRDDLHRTGTKEGCREGDCGACTVVVARLEGDPPRLRFRPVDACITLLRSLDGCAVWTVEDLAGPDGALHPAQQAMIDHHGSQCGFCTPGIVMSLYALYRQRVAAGGGVDRDASEAARADVVRALAGNLCRCTGYRSIVDAGAAMATYPPPSDDSDAVVALLTGIRGTRTLDDVLRQRRDEPDAVVVGGATDVGVWLNDGLADVTQVISLHGVEELERIADTGEGLVIGAAAALEDAWAALCDRRPELADYAERFAGPQVRAMGTMGGNLVTASPIGDCAPVLIALGAHVRVASCDAERTVPVEDFFLGYRHCALRSDEILVSVTVPHPTAGEVVRAYKHSRRHDDDISTVALAVGYTSADGTVSGIRIGAGGVAPTPARARVTEAAVLGRRLEPDTVIEAAATLRAEFTPIDDVRAGADNRRDVLAALLRRALGGDGS